ncbi:hypothetical protein MYX65_01535 [Acidobacteria bacterium AH-259-L09]|nr:hypothetical protein [Acidobacteria bacterium AH-259-L09]
MSQQQIEVNEKIRGLRKNAFIYPPKADLVQPTLAADMLRVRLKRWPLAPLAATSETCLS